MKVIEASEVLKKWYTPTNEFYSQVIDSLEDYAILTTDKELIINSWNSGAKKIFKYEGDEILGKHFEVIFTEEDRKNDVPLKEAKTALKEGRSTDERWHIRKDNSEFYASGLVFPLNDIEVKHIGFVKILRNLTERKKSEEAIKNYLKELEELNVHKEKTLSVLSHDLRSPLTSMIGTAELLKSKFDTMEQIKVKKMLDILHRSSKNLLSMLDNLVEWARIKYAAETFSPENIKLTDYVKEAFDTLNENAAIKKINFHNRIKENVIVFADVKMLLSILQNLLSNAIKYTNSGGEIIVTAITKEDKIIIKIKDSGKGMSKKIQEKLFTPQVESLSATRKEEKGAGIGLLLVKGFVAKNGGGIWIESEEGKGSSFYFTLPIQQNSSN